MTVPALTRDVARTLLLDAQGLLDDPARRLTSKALYQTIEDMGYVQIDSINTLERAHHLTLAARFDAYRPAALSKLLEETRELFEHWTHDASAIPTRWFPHWHHRFELSGKRIRASKWWMHRMGKDPEAMLAKVEARIVREGPLLARDFEVEGPFEKPEQGWWGWKPEKAALEYLWHTGKLAVARRINFQKVYDLTARVFPKYHALPPPERAAHVDWAARHALDRLGVATPRELAAFWDMITLQEAAAWCPANAVKVTLDGKTAYAVHDWEKRVKRAAEAPDRIRLLSPFDPIMRDRKRTLRLFDFDYRIEVFVPAPKRVYGYYVLPILERDRLIGRIDPKLDRERGELTVQGLWWEKGIKPTKQRKKQLGEALERLATLVGAKKIIHR